MRFSTPIEISPSPFQLTPQSHIVVLGSCFAEHIGQRLAFALPPDRVSVNPFGVLYHPTVLARALARIAFSHALFSKEIIRNLRKKTNSLQKQIQ